MRNVEAYSQADLFRQVPNLDQRKLLDLGSGQKKLMVDSFLQAGGDKSKITMLDKRFLNLASGFGDRVKANAAILPFENNSFDLVSMGWLIDLLAGYSVIIGDAEKAVKEVNRVLKPGGYFIGDYSETLRVSDFEEIMAGSEGLVPAVIFRILGTINSWNDKRALVKAGFKVIVFDRGYEKQRKVEHKLGDFDFISTYFVAQKPAIQP